MGDQFRTHMMLMSGQIAAMGLALNRLIRQSDDCEALKVEIGHMVDQVARKAEEEGTVDHLMLAKGLRDQALVLVGRSPDGDSDSPPH